MGVLTNPVLIVGARLLESFLYAQATHLLVNSPAYRDYLIKKGIRVDKITLIANGVDPSMFNSEDQGLHIRSTLHVDDKFVITYAGAIGLANDIPTILNAAEILKDNSQIHFLLVGDGKERAKLEDSVRARNLTNVTFTGSRPKSDMAGILAASDACLATLQDIPMFRTTYPNKVFDYMAAARPTILGIDGVIRDVIEAANGGIFVQPGSARALADAVAQLAENQDTAREMGRSARTYVVEHFNRADQSRAFTDLIRRIATRS
jgi:glycosyltransferase involved in cell wall biosynthesis